MPTDRIYGYIRQIACRERVVEGRSHTGSYRIAHFHSSHRIGDVDRNIARRHTRKSGQDGWSSTDDLVNTSSR